MCYAQGPDEEGDREETAMTPRETVAEMYRLYGSGDYEAVIARATDDAVYIAFGDPNDVFAGRFQGKDVLRERFGQTHEMFAFEHFEPIEILVEGDRVASRCACIAVAKPTGDRVDTQLAHFWRIRDGRWSEIIEYFDTARVGGAVAACR